MGFASGKNEECSEAEQDRAGERYDRPPHARIEWFIEQGAKAVNHSAPPSVVGGWAKP